MKNPTLRVMIFNNDDLVDVIMED